MKNLIKTKNFSLSIFVCLLFLTMINQLSSNKLKSKMDNKDYEIYFQKVYSGTNPVQIINLSDSSFKKLILSVNQQLLILKTLPTEIIKTGEVFDTTVIKDIYNEKLDNAGESKCCENVKFIKYQECTGNCSKTGLIAYEANSCLEISFKTTTWRICSENSSLIKNLDFTIRSSIITQISKKVDFKKFIQNSFNEKKYLKSWDWHNQLTWGDVCENTEVNLQSPIILDNPDEIKIGEEGGSTETIPDLNMDYSFDKVEPVITKNGREIIVGFPSFVGLFRMKVGDKSLVFQPNFLAFRFNSEHQIASKRFDGEIEVHFTELNPDKKSWLTNGLVISIFLESMKETKSLKFLESLKLDFWKLNLKEKNLSNMKTDSNFCLQSLFDSVFKLSPKYYLYKGSLTTPPCTSNVLRLVFDKSIKVPEIQFNVLREQSLLDLREKEIHARLTQKALERDVVKGDCKNISYNKNLENYLETSLSPEIILASKTTQETATGDNLFTPPSREYIRDAILKFDNDKSIYQLERKLKDSDNESKVVLKSDGSLVSTKEDCSK